MPLLDHLRPPLSGTRRWESFHAAWAVQIMRRLNRGRLPHGFAAEVQAHVGPNIEVGVGAFDLADRHLQPPSANGGGVAVLAQPTWVAVPADQEMPALFPDIFEVRVLNQEKGEIVAAIELVSPGNKDRPEARAAFVAKCAFYLQMGVGLVVVDVLDNRHFNLHDELVEFLKAEKEYSYPDSPATYAVAYRPVHAEEFDRFEIWKRECPIGDVLPDLPLPLGPRQYVQLELEFTYRETCLDCQIQ